mgnify:CR=1 FL=1
MPGLFNCPGLKARGEKQFKNRDLALNSSKKNRLLVLLSGKANKHSGFTQIFDPV